MKKKLLNFRVLLFTLLFFLLIGIFFEAFPIQYYHSTAPFKNKSGYTYNKQFNRLLIVSNSEEPVSFEQYYDHPELLFKNTKSLIEDKYNIVDLIYIDKIAA